MASHPPSGPLETGVAMDYPEHRATYNRFLLLTKYGTLTILALLISMAFGFFVSGFISAAILFVLILAVGSFAMR